MLNFYAVYPTDTELWAIYNIIILIYESIKYTKMDSSLPTKGKWNVMVLAEMVKLTAFASKILGGGGVPISWLIDST